MFDHLRLGAVLHIVSDDPPFKLAAPERISFSDLRGFQLSNDSQAKPLDKSCESSWALNQLYFEAGQMGDPDIFLLTRISIS